MKAISLFNDVLGPVMRGPSSSHTAAPFQIGAMARALLGGEPAAASFTFDPGGSFAQVYRQQGSDRGFAAGILGWSLTDERFPRALELAPAEGLDLAFRVAPLPEADHPNTVAIHLRAGDGRRLDLVANSIGGGAFVFTRVGGWPVQLTGDGYELLVELASGAEEAARALLAGPAARLERPGEGEKVLLHARRLRPPPPETAPRLADLPGVSAVWAAPPVFFPLRGLEGEPDDVPLFSSGAGMLAYAEAQGCSLGEAALAYEAALLGLPPAEILAETQRRYGVMRAAVERGLGAGLPPMQLLRPSAGRIMQAEREGRLATGGLHTRAAARAMAVMHVNGGMGVVCAAPTAGSAGTLPGVVVTLADELGLEEPEIARALLAASGVGLVVAQRATFAAEVAGCQVEIGAAGAMAAAAVVEAAGGSPRQAADAAAIAFQNTMGSVCDLVQGIVEIPCHTRNAAAAANAFLCADLILGGYENPIPLDETVDAVYAVGRMLPCELKVTALGGLALAPSARALPRLHLG
jgi:L-serine dehydratase